MKKVLIASMAMLASIGFAGTAFAFHGGGVAHCDGCHTMHNSQDGAAINPNGGVGDTGNGFLMVGADPSSTCLTCHAGGANGYHVQSTDGTNYQPGGDFFWLSFDQPIPRSTLLAESKGHNTVAADYGIVADATLVNAPSDGEVVFPAAALGCNSCHDPHGKVANNTNPLPISVSGSYGAAPAADTMAGNYRLLGGAGYDGGQNVANLNLSFAAGAPTAVAPSLFTPGGETDTNFVAYGSGMSEWCANCHSGFDAAADGSGSAPEHKHPAGNNAAMTGKIATNYDAYVTTGVMDGTKGYDVLVPYEQGVVKDAATNAVDTAVLNHSTAPTSATAGNAMCLSCHRAHATPFGDIARWDFATDILANSSQLTASAMPGTETHVYYGRDIATAYGPAQRSLCNKCHAQD